MNHTINLKPGQPVTWTQDYLHAEAVIVRRHAHDDDLWLIRVAGGEHWARAQDLSDRS